MKHSPARVLPIVLVTLLAGLAPADEEPTSEAVLDFFKNQIPEAFVILKHVQENEPIDIYQERFDHFSDVFIEYHNCAIGCVLLPHAPPRPPSPPH